MSSAGAVFITVLLATLMLPWVSVFLLRRQKPKAANTDEVAVAPAADMSSPKTDSNAYDNDTENGKTKILTSTTIIAGESTVQLAVHPNTANASSTLNYVENSTRRDKESGNNNWRCACEGGFLPSSMFGNMEAVVRMGGGQCYHKNR